MVLQRGGGGFEPAVLSKRPYIIGGGNMNNNKEQEIKELEARIADLKQRWPAHSLRPAMIREMEELEERLEALKGEIENDSSL